MSEKSNKRMKLIALAASMAVAAIWPATSVFAATNREVTDDIRRSETAQLQIKGQTQKAVEELTSIIQELERNGIGGQDVKILSQIRAILGTLSDKDMPKVVMLLQQARNMVNPTQVREHVTTAINDQAQIMVKMQQLLLEFEREQKLYVLSLHFTELAEREHVNMKSAVASVKAGQPQLEQNRESVKRQMGEQDAITQTTKNDLAILRQLAAESDAQTAERLKKSIQLAEQQRLEPLLQAASDDLKIDHIRKAADDERYARNALFELARLVIPDQDTLAKLRRAAESLDKAIVEEKVVINQTTELDPKHVELERAAQIEDRQSDNVELTHRLRGDLDLIAPDVEKLLRLAEDKMQESRQSLNDRQRDPSLDREQVALAKLVEARQALQDQIAKTNAEKLTGTPEEQAKQLLERVIALRKDEETLEADTAAVNAATATALNKRQLQLEQRDHDLQVAAVAVSEPVAREIAEAGKDMDRAATTLSRVSVPESQSAEKSAVDHLLTAEKLLNDRIAKLDEEQKDLASLEEARDKVAKLIKDEQKVALDTAKAAAKQDEPKADAAKPDAAKPDAAKNDAAKNDAAKNDAAKNDAAKEDAAKNDAAKEDAAKNDAAKSDQAKNDPAKDDQAKNDAAKNDAAKNDAAKADQPKTDQAKNDAAKNDAAKADQPKTDQAKNDAAKNDAAKSDQAKADQAKNDQAKNDQAKNDAAKNDAGKNQPDAKADSKQLGKDQGEVAKNTDAAKKSLPEEGKDAAEPLENAKKEMAAAKGKLDNNDAKSAQPKENEAISQLNKAKGALDDKIKQMQKDLGQTPDDAAKLDDIASKLDQAQKDITAAQNELNNPAKELAKKQQAVAKAIDDAAAKDPTNPDLKKAQAAADQAAADLNADQVPSAIKAMKKAETALADAQKPDGDKPDGKKPDGDKPDAQAKDPSQKPDGQKPEGQAKDPGQKPDKEAVAKAAKDQSDVTKAAEKLLDDQAKADQATADLGKAAGDVTDAQADAKGALPQSAQDALQDAQKALNDAAGQAQAGKTPDAQANAAKAQAAVTKAQAAVALAKEGLQSGQLAQNDPAKGDPGQDPGQGDAPPGDQPGDQAKGDQPGQGKPGKPGQPGKPENTPTDENQMTQANGDRKDTNANANANGARGSVTGKSTYLALPARDRDAIQQTQNAKYPQEYGPAIEQYLKNLSDQENRENR